CRFLRFLGPFLIRFSRRFSPFQARFSPGFFSHPFPDFSRQESLESRRARGRAERLERLLRLNEQRCGLSPVYGREVLQFLTLPPRELGEPGGALEGAVLTPPQRLQHMKPILDRFLVAVPAVASRGVSLHSGRPPPWAQRQRQRLEQHLREELRARGAHLAQGLQTQFPDPRLVQYDCGKLQALDVLLRRLRAGGHRVLIFTQMTRMLDVLERFLTFHGHIYLRLDGSTRVEQRQV
ncbi:helicase SRCAP-like, partial [Serinus canaria]|uniref:helicase SRCAP-like n=1 Tax=Serinus canaria TaxID=9135 RepID=UPI0021CD0195